MWLALVDRFHSAELASPITLGASLVDVSIAVVVEIDSDVRGAFAFARLDVYIPFRVASLEKFN